MTFKKILFSCFLLFNTSLAFAEKFYQMSFHFPPGTFTMKIYPGSCVIDPEKLFPPIPPGTNPDNAIYTHLNLSDNGLRLYLFLKKSYQFTISYMASDDAISADCRGSGVIFEITDHSKLQTLSCAYLATYPAYKTNYELGCHRVNEMNGLLQHKVYVKNAFTRIVTEVPSEGYPDPHSYYFIPINSLGDMPLFEVLSTH